MEAVPALISAMEDSGRAILQAPPGAGKSTVVPLILLDQKWINGKKIILLEPRRLAARAVAERMASLLGEKTGETVGYRIRFETKVSSSTRIEVVTEGILVRMLQQDNFLSNTGLVILDEFHERNLHADLSLTLLKEVQESVRPDLKILIMSATLNADVIADWLEGTKIITSQGRQFPVKEVYAPFPQEKALPVACSETILKAVSETEGDILVFLPGTGDIKRTAELLENKNTSLIVHPLYGELPFTLQQAALRPDENGRRKVVLATSIAETSLTIEGVNVVIDSGLARVPRFSTTTGLSRLETVPVSRDAADQRKGRAGRLGPGTCYRMWAAAYTERLPETRKPEISESDLVPLILELANWGNSNPGKYSWLTPPNPKSVDYAQHLLKRLEALDEDGRITTKGKEIAGFPAHPRIACLLLEGKSKCAAPLATDLAALLEERDFMPTESGTDIYYRIVELRKYRETGRSQFNTILARIERSAGIWRRSLKTEPDNKEPDHTLTGELLFAAYPDRVGQKKSDTTSYKLSGGGNAGLRREDPLGDESYIVISSLDVRGKEAKIFLASSLNADFLKSHAAWTESLRWDYQSETLVQGLELRYDALILDRKDSRKVDEEAHWKVIRQVIVEKGQIYLNWDDKVQSIQNRILSVKHWHPEEEWPDVSTEALLADPDKWLRPFITNIRNRQDFSRIDLHEPVKSLLSWEQQKILDQRAPEKMEVPTGSKIKLEYFPDGSSPVLAVRLQEVFGWTETPVIDNGKIRLTLHLLSPGYKVVQITGDLKNFWENTYQEVKKEMKRRYPRHSWPEDPLNAVAVRGVKRK